nr:zinc finger BED domain-containing protein RICESLEEPER 2-like [Malus domestica]
MSIIYLWWTTWNFKWFCNSLQPLFKVISRSTIKRDIMKVFECEKGETMKLLQMNKSKIAITVDMWTSSNQKRGFMAITSHFIDASWTLQSQILRFAYVPCPHNAETLSAIMIDCLSEWNTDDSNSTQVEDSSFGDDTDVNVASFGDNESMILCG